MRLTPGMQRLGMPGQQRGQSGGAVLPLQKGHDAAEASLYGNPLVLLGFELCLHFRVFAFSVRMRTLSSPKPSGRFAWISTVIAGHPG
jgi:hypothetical protein